MTQINSKSAKNVHWIDKETNTPLVQYSNIESYKQETKANYQTSNPRWKVKWQYAMDYLDDVLNNISDWFKTTFCQSDTKNIENEVSETINLSQSHSNNSLSELLK